MRFNTVSKRMKHYDFLVTHLISIGYMEITSKRLVNVYCHDGLAALNATTKEDIRVGLLDIVYKAGAK